jgi:phosphate acetyltransferase
MFHDVIAHGLLAAALVSALFGTQFPGPGTIYLGQELSFTKPVPRAHWRHAYRAG